MPRPLADILDNPTVARLLSAVVQGTHAYRVELVSAAAGIEFRCTCPIGVEGAFCKHCVAVSRCWLEGRTPQAPALDGEVREYLLTLDSEELVSLLIEVARDDPRLAERLRARLITSAEPPDIGALAGLIGRAFVVHGFVHYREMWDYVSGIGEAIDALEGDRLRHVHVSSLSPELHHMPLSEQDEELFRPFLERCMDVPWILEAPPRVG